MIDNLNKAPTDRLLRHAKASVVRDDNGMLTVSVIPSMPHVTVQIKACDLRAWCIKRIETRATHKGRGIGIHSRKYNDWL